MRILLVEDDEALGSAMQRALRGRDHAVDRVSDGRTAQSLLRTEAFDLIVLDLGLPGLDGLTLLRQLRQRGADTPVLVVTARGEVEQRVTGLDTGADDYLVKPFELSELKARVRALLRRGQGKAAPLLVHGPVSFDTVARRVSLNGAPLELPRRELCLLEVLLGRVGQVVSKEQIAEKLFDFDDDAGLNAIEIYVHRLRKRLGPAGVNIRTVRGLGYLLEQP